MSPGKEQSNIQKITASLSHSSFKDMMNDVVAAGSCCECGSCVTVCPHNIIEYIDGKPRQTAKANAAFDFCGISEGVGCDVCASVCPRLWPRENHLKDMVFRSERPYEGIFGVYRHIFVAKTQREDILSNAQDGGIVTALLHWAFEKGIIDGAVAATVGEDDPPCLPSPKVLTSTDEIKASAGSWYTYCPNNRALEEVTKLDLKQVGFVGVPCQITPLRKMEHIDPAFLVTERKREKFVGKQRDKLRGFSERIKFNIGLFCTEVFTPELMTEKIEKEMGIPLTQVSKFNIKGEVLIHKKDGGLEKIPLPEVVEKYQRPECHHCNDFSAEMADISCGGVGTNGATLVIIRTRKGESIWRQFQADNTLFIETIEKNKRAWNILLMLSRRQRNRAPEGSARSGTTKDLPQYSARIAADFNHAKLAQSQKPQKEVEASLKVAYRNESPPGKTTDYSSGAPIPGDPGAPAPGEKRKKPPPPGPQRGGAPPR